MKKIPMPIITGFMAGMRGYQFIHQLFIPLLKEKHDTKIFCVGCEKTGTSSLSKALSILGYRSIHWLRAGVEPSEGWILYIRKSRYDAFADRPMNTKNFFKTLDKEFPNSKFILTIRDTPSLLKSWEQFFQGTPLAINSEEDRQKVQYHYELHTQEVRNYFIERPSQLLIMNLFEGDGWRSLCEFLEKPIPDKPFPHKKKGNYKKQVYSIF